ncbi:MAG TPA: substrate-binding domain-containing protein [Gammaproteobacteria bacterium]|nr:substrate-binding domain-containing protein [Gammaproteobacteria bacterium]
MSRGVSVNGRPVFATLLAGLAALLAALAALAAAGAPRGHVVVAGSSTVFPFAAAVAERAPRPGPLVLPMGTGAGIAWFCEGLGPATPDVVLASRPMTPTEASACRVAGVTPLDAVPVGRDGIVLASAPGHPIAALSLAELWLAVARRVPDPRGGSGWVPNPHARWSEIRADLPDLPIRVLGPPATSGTRDALSSLALRPACEAALADSPRADAERRACGEIRRDGAWVDAGENDDVLAARLGSDPAALGVVGYGALLRNAGRVRGVCFDGACPTAASISAGDYPLARTLYLYFKPAHRGFVPGLEAFVAGFRAPDAVGVEGWLTRLGLVPLPPAAPAARPPHGTVPPPVAAEAGLSARVTAVVLAIVLVALLVGSSALRRAVPAQRALERGMGLTLWSSAAVAGALLAVVLAALVVPAVNFFLQVSPREFLAGTHWSPESAIRAAQSVGEGAFGVLPVLLGSVVVAGVALLLALPLALGAALHAHAWAGRRFRRAWRHGIRVAAFVPTVIFGLFAALTVAPAVAAVAGAVGLAVAPGNLLAAGLVVGIMLLPVLALRIGDALESVPTAAADAALGLGATRWEVLRDVVLPSAAGGIGAAVLLAVSRALGETVVVLMAAGLVAQFTLDPLAANTTLTAQMVALMSGTHALENVRTQLPFVLGLLLAALVLPLNAWAFRLLRKSDVSPSPVF